MVKKIIIILLCTITSNVAEATELPFLKPNCPNIESILKTTLADTDELVRKLNDLIPIAYPDNEYNKWNVIKIVPLPSVIGVQYDDAYYRIAIRLCGEPIANNSWIVKVEFPKLLPSTSPSGIFFVVKTKNSGWNVWYSYR
ncbi:hypothetical protein WAK64_02640 [Bacillus spongiae]|uniref:DUF3888 domain-containing protein n=1 Tax=Bacillus spongiae TaxID=2683610 RepID=A0ABU8H9G4_9BACI